MRVDLLNIWYWNSTTSPNNFFHIQQLRGTFGASRLFNSRAFHLDGKVLIEDSDQNIPSLALHGGGGMGGVGGLKGQIRFGGVVNVT